MKPHVRRTDLDGTFTSVGPGKVLVTLTDNGNGNTHQGAYTVSGGVITAANIAQTSPAPTATPAPVTLGCTLAGAPGTTGQRSATLLGAASMPRTVTVQFSDDTSGVFCQTTQQVQFNASGQGTLWVNASSGSSQIDTAESDYGSEGIVQCAATVES